MVSCTPRENPALPNTQTHGRSRMGKRKSFCMQCSVSLWNSLPHEAAMATNLDGSGEINSWRGRALSVAPSHASEHQFLEPSGEESPLGPRSCLRVFPLRIWLAPVRRGPWARRVPFGRIQQPGFSLGPPGAPSPSGSLSCSLGGFGHWEDWLLGLIRPGSPSALSRQGPVLFPLPPLLTRPA